MSRCSLFFGFFAIVCLATGCDDGSGTDRRATLATDSWFVASPMVMEGRNVPDDHFALVIDEWQEEAQGQLAEVSMKVLSADDAIRFTGRSLPSDGQLVLLRAVVLNDDARGFEITVDRETVHVGHGCLGRHPVPMKRKAVIAVLPVAPKTVYATCGMAE